MVRPLRILLTSRERGGAVGGVRLSAAMVLSMGVSMGLGGVAHADEESPVEEVEQLPRERVSTSLGVRGVTSVATGGEVDFETLLHQRLRWRVVEGGPGVSMALINGRFAVDPLDGVTLERSQVTSLAVETTAPAWQLTLGRSAIAHGGPRLVDGAQGVWRFGGGFSLGAWGGLAPDLFTTLPRARYGGGVIAAYSMGSFSSSLISETLVESGGFDRVGGLLQVKMEQLPLGSVGGRLDMQVNTLDNPIISDANVWLRARPIRGLRLRADLQAYSSYRYLRSEDLDPGIRRFATRVVDLGLIEGIEQDSMDDTLYYQATGGVDYRHQRGDGGETGAGLTVRGRVASPVSRISVDSLPYTDYVMLSPWVGSQGHGGGRFGATLDGSLRFEGEGLQVDAGVVLTLAGGEESDWLVDQSTRVLLSPAYLGLPGLYTDLFADFATEWGLTFSGGLFAAIEHDDIVDELSMGGFALLTWGARGERPLLSLVQGGEL